MANLRHVKTTHKSQVSTQIHHRRERILIELMTSDRKFETSREGSARNEGSTGSFPEKGWLKCPTEYRPRNDQLALRREDISQPGWGSGRRAQGLGCRAAVQALLTDEDIVCGIDVVANLLCVSVFISLSLSISFSFSLSPSLSLSLRQRLVGESRQSQVGRHE